jgi:hypothetical protein
VSEDPPFSENQILGVVLRLAAEAGDDHPSLIQHIAGPHDLAVKIGSVGNKVFDQTRCYLIALRGSFVLNNATRPAGAAAPRGIVMIIFLNARTGALMGRGLGDRYPDLDRLGPVTTDVSR